MRTVKATAAALAALIGAGAAAVAAGRLAGDAALKPAPGRPLPTEPRLTVHAATGDRVTLTRALASRRPGVYGLAGDGSHAVVGPVLDHEPHLADTVVRELRAVTHGGLAPGDHVWFTPQVHVGDPRSALGLEYENAEIPGELGTLPAWFLPGARRTWVITVHGLGTTREHPLVVMDFLHRHKFPVLDLAYRGDLGAPAAPGGLGHFGESEWRDLDAAIGHALRAGAENVVLYGWSTGASMALRAAALSPRRDRIKGLVLDSPVLSWQSALTALARARRTPAALMPLAIRATEGRTGLPPERVDRAADPRALEVPALAVHSRDDVIAPYRLTRTFAEARPDLVTLSTVDEAPHASAWNADPAAYEETLRRFLTPLM